MLYTLKYLPVDKPLEDGCTVINLKGEHFTYDAASAVGWNLDSIRVAEPFLVSNEFNQQVIVGKPMPSALKWLKPGMVLKSVDCCLMSLDQDNVYFMLVGCPTCGKPHGL